MASKMLYAVDISLKELGAEKETKKDKAARELARHYANFIDEAISSGDPDAAQRAMEKVGPNLQRTLASLGLTPESRGELKAVAEVKPKESKLDEIRKRRLQKAAAG